jgi:hypothetical protein
VVPADGLRQQVHAVDAVLKRDDDRLRTDERRKQRGGGFGVVELDGEEDRVNGPIFFGLSVALTFSR